MLQPLYHSPHAPRKESHTPTAVGVLFCGQIVYNIKQKEIIVYMKRVH